MRHLIVWRILIFCFPFLFLSGCVCDMSLKYDNGTSWRRKGKTNRYGIQEAQFLYDVTVYSDKSGVTIGGVSKYNAPSLIKDTVSTINFIEDKLSFKDGTVLEKKSEPVAPGLRMTCYNKEGERIPCLNYFYTCDGFKKKLRKNKYTILKIVYDLDSAGIVSRREKEYLLVKKRYYRFAVH